MRFILPVLALTACGIENDLSGGNQNYPLSDPPPIDNPIQEDRIVQVVEPVVDILFVVDNSSSMGNEQNALQNNFPNFIDHFLNAGLDYHIGMVSTDMQRPLHSGKLRPGLGQRFITNETVDGAAVFAAMTASLGVFIGSVESGRAPVYSALEIRRDDPENVDFYRENADLHIIFVSDDNDQSGQNPVTYQEFIQWADSLKTDSRVFMHGIITPMQPCNGNAPSVAYHEYADLFNGVTHNICAGDWEPALDALGVQTSGLKREFFLTRIPVFDPDLLLQVHVRHVNGDGEELIIDFVTCMAGEEIGDPTCQVTYNRGRNSIVFLEYEVTPLDEVFATYNIAENHAAETE